MDELDLEEIAGLVDTWRRWLRYNPVADEGTRRAGYHAGLTVCADQLEEIVNRFRQNVEVTP